MNTWEIRYVDRAFRRHVIVMVSEEKPTLCAAAALVQARETGNQPPEFDLAEVTMEPLVFLLGRGIIITNIAPGLSGQPSAGVTHSASK